MNNPHAILRSLGLSASEIKVYLAMQSGLLRVKDIVKATRLVRPTVYYAINGLEQRALVSRITIDEENHWRVSPPSRLEKLVEKERRKIDAIGSDVSSLVSQMKLTAGTDEQPIVSYFEGVEAVLDIAMESLYCKSKEILSIAPTQNFFRDVGNDSIRSFLSERSKRKIHTKHLWEKMIKSDVRKKYYSKAEIRILPEIMHGKFDTTIFIYDDKTLYISSKKNSYGILVQSKEHTDMMRALFSGLWIGSFSQK